MLSCFVPTFSIGFGVTGGTCTHLAGATNQRTTACATVTFDPQFFSEEIKGDYFLSRYPHLRTVMEPKSGIEPESIRYKCMMFPLHYSGVFSSVFPSMPWSYQLTQARKSSINNRANYLVSFATLRSR